jgi:hypothetical protein
MNQPIDDAANARQRREAELRFIVCATTIEGLAGAADWLQKLITSDEPFHDPIHRFAQRLTQAVVERTRAWHPLDPTETAVVVNGLTTTLLQVFIGTCRSAAVKSEKKTDEGEPER